MARKRLGLSDPGAMDVGTPKARTRQADGKQGDAAGGDVVQLAPTARGERDVGPVTGEPNGSHGADAAGTTEPPAQRASFVTALQGGGVANTVALRGLAEHPDNPREELGDLTELAASIAAIGVLQPLVVAPARIFARSHPQHADTIADAEYVVLAGHRRRAAAELADIDEVPAVIRDDLAGSADAAAVFLHENLGRRDLSPLEQARGFQLLLDLGVSQTKIAKEYSVSQSHVSKRIKLLRLPPRVQEAMRAGEFNIKSAEALGDLPPGNQEDAFDLAQRQRLPVEQAGRQVARERTVEEVRAKADRRAKREKLTLIDPAEEFGTAAHRHRLHDGEEIAKAKEADLLVGAVTNEGLAFYSRRAKRDRYAESQAREDRERKAAIKARSAAAADLVATPPGAQAVRDELARAMLTWIQFADSLKLTHKWLGAKLGERVTDAYQWRDSLRSPAEITHAAWAMTLANEELRARYSHGQWSEREQAWLERLQRDASYTPTDWELQKLAAVDARALDDDDLDRYSAGIPDDEE